ncbi:MAG TPA: hypothetical protein VHR45_10745 [Thermoanaerobaculia bacterium]|nr:hypothetical protein [Thermoanaerobaculia bacterium]
MGTFHRGKSELHGITVVVDTTGPEIFIGRCDDENEHGIVLDDVDVHRAGEGGRSKEDYLDRAARLGVWKKHDRLFIPREKVASVRRLGEL